MSLLRPVPLEALREQPWANGAGRTTVIASGPDGLAWRWRLSLAQIDRDGDFSTLADTRRQLVTLDAPLCLRFADGRQQPLLRLGRIAFDGADAPQASLPEGPTRAFNLMLRGTAQGELLARPLNGAMWLPLRPGWRWFAHLLSGRANVQAELEHREMGPGQNLWIDARPGQRVRIEGGGELVLVQLAD